MIKPKKHLKKFSYQRMGPKTVTLTPYPWDKGANGQANLVGLQEEDATELDPTTGKPIPNPNGVKRMRRVDMLEVWQKKGTITTAGYNAAVKLRNAFEATMKAPGWPDNDRVQSSAKPDQAVAIAIDRISAFHAINKLIGPMDRAIIDTCIIMGRSASHIRDKDGKRPYYGQGSAAGLAHVRNALDRLARAMGN